MKLRTLTTSAAALALAAALLVPVSAQAATTTPAQATSADGLVRIHDDALGDGVIEPSGSALRQDSSFTEFPEGGGTWYHGVKDGKVYSNFYHYTRKHGSSVKDGDGHLTSSAIVAARQTSNASRAKTLAGNTSYYRFG